MSDAQQFYKNSQLCLNQAQRAGDQQSKAALTQMAAYWAKEARKASGEVLTEDKPSRNRGTWRERFTLRALQSRIFQRSASVISGR